MAAGQSQDPYIASWFTLVIEDPQVGSLGDWQTCSGLQIEYELEPMEEGGRNDFSWRLPGRIKNATNVKLTRAIAGPDEAARVVRYLHTVAERISEGIDGFMPATIVLHHRGSAGEPIAWTLQNAFPVKWTGPSLEVGTNKVATETLELAYHGLTCEGA
jgi:phage tail-like protein